MLQQALEKHVGDEFDPSFCAGSPRSSATLAIQLQGKLMKRENVDIQQREPLLHDQQLLKRTTQLIRGHDKRDGGLGMAGLESTKIVNELRFECGMELAGDEAEHGDRGPSIVKREAEGRRECLATFRTSRVKGEHALGC